MVRKRILIEGDVQDVAYRIFVKKVAKDLKIKGLVRNLPDGTVEVLCETDEKVLKKFLAALKSCRYDGMQNAGRVSNIDVFDQKQRARPFKSFEIDYGHKVKGLAKEEMHRQELMVYHGSELRSEMRSGFDKLGKRVDSGFKGLGQKMDNGFNGLGQKVEGVGEKVQSMHKDMNEKFTGMEQKYHTINKNIERSDGNIERMTKEISVIAKALLELVESNIQQNGKRAKKT
jgi:acylphosphatase